MTRRPLLSGISVLIVVLSACGGDVVAPTPSDAGWSTDAGAPGYTIINSIKCCNQGTGTSCCASDDSYCEEFQGCSGPGGFYSAKAVCTACCDGLKAITTAKLEHGECTHPITEALLCAACGDGVCDDTHGENSCNCAADCK